MSVGGAMFMRCDITQRVQSGTDDYGQPKYRDIANNGVECFIWAIPEKLMYGLQQQYSYGAYKAFFPPTISIGIKDKISNVVTRNGKELYPNRAFIIESTWYRPSHVEALITTIHGGN